MAGEHAVPFEQTELGRGAAPAVQHARHGRRAAVPHARHGRPARRRGGREKEAPVWAPAAAG